MNIPSDLFFLFLIRMDFPMIDSILDEDEKYMGLDADGFGNFIKDKINHHKALGDTSLLALPGKYDQNSKLAYSFLGNKSKETMAFVVEVNEKKEMLSFHEHVDFIFDEFPFNIDDF